MNLTSSGDNRSSRSVLSQKESLRNIIKLSRIIFAFCLFSVAYRYNLIEVGLLIFCKGAQYLFQNMHSNYTH